MPAAAYIDRVETSTTFDAQFRDADLNLRVLVSGGRGFGAGGRDGAPAGGGPGGASTAPDYDLRAILAGPDGKEVQRSVLNIPAHCGTARDTLLTMHVNAPRHWTAETPDLYRLTVELVQGGAVAHARTSAVGFRQISTTGGVVRINGQAVKTARRMPPRRKTRTWAGPPSGKTGCKTDEGREYQHGPDIPLSTGRGLHRTLR